MSIQVLPIECHFGPVRAYTYYIDGAEPVLIDTGVSASVLQIEQALQQHNYQIENIRWILLTHGHVDHLGGVKKILEKTNYKAKVVIPAIDAPLLTSVETHIQHYQELQAQFVSEAYQIKHIEDLQKNISGGIKPDIVVQDHDVLTIYPGLSFTVYETPGHSLGSVSYLINETNWLFVADAVQIYGGELSGVPAVEYPNLYRESINKILYNIKPHRLYVGHPFRKSNGTVFSETIDGSEVQLALQESLDMDNKLRSLMAEYGTITVPPENNDSLYGTFEPIAKKLNYTGDPRNMPCAFFVTMHSYLQTIEGEIQKL